MTLDFKLKTEDEELVKKFRSLRTRTDIANLLEIDLKHLIYLLYRAGKSKYYSNFTITKKGGGERQILAPLSSLKILQSKLNEILNLIYEPQRPVHGFCRDRDITTNAQLHTRKRTVLNFDIKDFFPSINFGRVRGLLMSPPFNFNHETATTLSQIFCYQNQLPQGAPSSPIISNMICARLDRELSNIAKRNKCFYSRYADDITFSSYKSSLPRNFAQVLNGDGALSFEIGELLESIVISNGFQINKSKVRIQNQYARQTVTGLIVNNKVNVRRVLIRKIRAIFNAIEKYGWNEAEKVFHEKYYQSKWKNAEAKPSLRRYLEGNINFIKLVKGERDPVYRKLVNKFLKATNQKEKYFTNPIKEIEAALWILESKFIDGDDTEYQLGTGFTLEGYGIVTCAHVLRGSTEAYKYDNPSQRFPIKIIKTDIDRDLAILEIENDSHLLKKGNTDILKPRSQVAIAGFPGYGGYGTPQIANAHITGSKTKHGLLRYYIDTPIIGGYSGGPVLNMANEVVGVMATGGENYIEAANTMEYGIIPIEEIDKITNK